MTDTGRSDSEAPFISAGWGKGVAGKNSAWRYLVAAIATRESIFVCCAKIAFGIKEFARGREVNGLHANFGDFAFIAAEPASITDIFPGLLVEQIHL